MWIAPQGADRVYKLNADTGATECSAAINGKVLATPVVATPPGGVTTVYMAALDSGGRSGPVVAYAESNCSQHWQWSAFIQGISAVWDPLSYGLDATGRGLLVFGSADPDSTVYALNAATGALVWHYATYSPDKEDWDVGAGGRSPLPGVNGFADGVAYIEGKDGILYAIDLTTGALVWQYNFGGNGPGINQTINTDALATPALTDSLVVFGDSAGMYAVNAVTGKKRWFVNGDGTVNSSAAIVGPAGSKVVAYGDLRGHFRVNSLATGALLYQYQTGSFISASPADANGTLLIASGDGFLYDFGLAGGNGSTPTTAVTYPSAGADLSNPDGNITVTGTASAPDGVAAVTAQVQRDGATGPWYNQATGAFQTGQSTAEATLASPGATSTTWSLSVPVSLAGMPYQLRASAVGENNVADGTAYASASNAAAVSFNLESSPLAPVVNVSPARVVPGGNVSLSSSGFSPGEQVTFTAQTSTGTNIVLAAVTADGSGSTSPAPAKMPLPSAFGADLVMAIGGASGEVGTGSVYVANDDPQALGTNRCTRVSNRMTR